MLEDGRTFTGQAYGAIGTTVGEAVFSTGMSGYQETLTDPSYHRQVVVMTAPHIGNTGVNDEDPESGRIWVAGYVVRDPARRPSNWRSTRTLDEELERYGVVGISGVDTRALTRHLRERGAMRAGIFSGEAAEQGFAAMHAAVLASPPMAGADLTAEVTTAEEYVVEAVGAQVRHRPGRRPRHQDDDPACGWPSAGCACTSCRRGSPRRTWSPAPARSTGRWACSSPTARATRRPPTTRWRRCARCWPSGSRCSASASATRSSAGPSGSAPTSSATATGGSTSRSPTGPPGGSRSRRTTTGSPSTHRWTGVSDTEFGRVEVSHVCLNDDVVEGLRCLDVPAFSVQYHPEAAAGPHDSAYLFDRFADLMEA